MRRGLWKKARNKYTYTLGMCIYTKEITLGWSRRVVAWVGVEGSSNGRKSAFMGTNSLSEPARKTIDAFFTSAYN